MMTQERMQKVMVKLFEEQVEPDLRSVEYKDAEGAWDAVRTGLSEVAKHLPLGLSPYRNWRHARMWIESTLGDLFELAYHVGGGAGPAPYRSPSARVSLREYGRVMFEEDIDALRKAGQLEYAGKDQDAFANFQRIGDELGLPREVVLWVYAIKHRDGIQHYLDGHTSQREGVRGRINDLIVYLFLLYGMLEDDR